MSSTAGLGPTTPKPDGAPSTFENISHSARNEVRGSRVARFENSGGLKPTEFSQQPRVRRVATAEAVTSSVATRRTRLIAAHRGLKVTAIFRESLRDTHNLYAPKPAGTSGSTLFRAGACRRAAACRQAASLLSIPGYDQFRQLGMPRGSLPGIPGRERNLACVGKPGETQVTRQVRGRE